MIYALVSSNTSNKLTKRDSSGCSFLPLPKTSAFLNCHEKLPYFQQRVAVFIRFLYPLRSRSGRHQPCPVPDGKRYICGYHAFRARSFRPCGGKEKQCFLPLYRAEDGIYSLRIYDLCIGRKAFLLRSRLFSLGLRWQKYLFDPALFNQIAISGAAGFTDDGIPLLGEERVRQAMERAGKMLSCIIFLLISVSTTQVYHNLKPAAKKITVSFPGKKRTL